MIKKILLFSLALGAIIGPHLTFAMTCLFPAQGGTGLCTATSSNVGQAIVVSSTVTSGGVTVPIYTYKTITGGGSSSTNVYGVSPISVSQVGTNATVTFNNPGYFTTSTGNGLYLQILNNLSDLGSTSSARTNIGYSALSPISISSTGTILFTNPGYITTTTYQSLNGWNGLSWNVLPGNGITSTISNGSTTFTLNLGTGCNGSNFVQTISPTGTITCSIPSGGSSTTINGVTSSTFNLIGDGTTISSTVSGATTTFGFIGYNGNWAGTWQGTNSTTFYLASNPSGYITTSTFNATGTPFYFPYWNASGTKLSATSSLFISSSTGNVGIGTTNPGQELEVDGNTLINPAGAAYLRVGQTFSFNGYNSMGGGMGNNVYYDGSNWRYITSNFGSLVWGGGNGEIGFYTFPSGTAGNVAPFTNRANIYTSGGMSLGTSFTDPGAGDFTIQSGVLTVSGTGNSSFAGNVGIGTTNPASSLQVNGNFQLSASSTIVTPSIGGGALLAGACASATSSIDTSVTSSTAAFVTTPRGDPGNSGWDIYSFLSAPGVLTTRVCADVAATPNALTYSVKVIK